MTTDKQKSFSARLQHAAERAGRDLTEVCRATGTSREMLNRYLNWNAEPSAGRLRAFAVELKTSTDYLLALTDDPAPRAG